MGLEADDARPEASTPLRRGVQTADRAVVRERQAIPVDQGRARHRAIDPATLGSGHPRQRLHPGHGQPHARAERAGRAGEARPAVGDGGGRFRTSGAGIRTKAGVIRANAARYPISALCRILGVPRSTYCWMTGIPGRSVWIRSPATCARSGATAADATAPERSRPSWKGGASPRPGGASATSCANRA